MCDCSLCRVMAPPVKAVLQPCADGAEVGGVSHHSAVQGVVPEIYR